jgi:O-antigen/teichoic acid export membrane protein
MNEDRDDLDVSTVDRSLKKIAKGGMLIFVGTFIGMAIQMVNRVIIVRSLSRADYGLISLGLVFFSITTSLSQSGFSQSIPRFLGYHRGKDDSKRITGVIQSSFEIGLSLAVILTLILIMMSGRIENFYDMKGLSMVIILFALGIPFHNLFTIIAHIFRGFDDAKPSVYFTNILPGGMRIFLLLAVILISTSLMNIMAAYVSAIVGTAVLAGLYFIRKKSTLIQDSTSITMRKELITFSLPLFGTVVLAQLMKWTDVLMLGHFTSADVVGLYNGAIPICAYIPIFLSSTGFIFIPVLSMMYSKGQLSEMKKTYSIITKWTFSVTLPLFLIIFIFSKEILTLLFGADYEGASLALRILSSGYMFHVLTGPIGQNLVIFAKPRLIVINNSMGLILNILLNFFLIPLYGMDGAAFATASTFILINILALIQVYRVSRMHPFSYTYLKPLAMSLLLFIGFFVVFQHVAVSYWVLPPLFLLFMILYIVILFITRSFDREDIMLITTLERRTGLNLGWLKNLLERFL